MDTERLAALVAALAIFVGLVAPGPMVAVGLAVVGVGLLVRLRGTRAGSRSAVHNRH